MARQLKVWGGNCFRDGVQVRGLVIATTKKRAIGLLSSVIQMTSYYFNGWWSETAHTTELSKLVQGEGVWVYSDLLGQSPCVRLAAAVQEGGVNHEPA